MHPKSLVPKNFKSKSGDSHDGHTKYESYYIGSGHKYLNPIP